MVLNALDRDAKEGRAVRGEMADELRSAMGLPPQGEAKHTYLVGYGQARGSGRSFETFQGTPTAKDIEALENLIQSRNNLGPVSITSISLLGNSHE
ncbi:hypothetical protein C1893_23280 [Pseudomonas sp. MPR-ANC1]|nr:hypothetical protein C1893_23280 [Pseudomonas sp. MPR-ANC1]